MSFSMKENSQRNVLPKSLMYIFFVSDGSLLQTSDLPLTPAIESQNLLSCLLTLHFLNRLDVWAPQRIPFPCQGSEIPLNGWLVKEDTSMYQRSFLLKPSLSLQLTLISPPSVLCIKLCPILYPNLTLIPHTQGHEPISDLINIKFWSCTPSHHVIFFRTTS